MSLIGIAGGVEVIIVVAFFILGYIIYLANESESKGSGNLTQDSNKELDIK